ncbi:MAG: class II fructose-bisphosphate aldolase [Firmicutes bacterium]|nr:class II fructose-bisphosphate aldolase [Bacillota bacterium]
MSLVNMNEMLKDASKHNYAVGAFNMVDINSMKAILDGAVEMNMPVIVSVAEVHFRYIDIEELSAVITSLASKAPVPVALHLDHGQSLNAIMKAVQSGFTSVMYDGSQLPLEENIANTAEIVKFAHAADISVEAELGHVGEGADMLEIDNADLLTSPSEADLFIEKTGVDALAVAVGSAHGVYKRKPKLDLERLQKIKQLTDIPLVLHGGSGIPDEDLRKSIKSGIAKINVYTELSQQAMAGISKELTKNENIGYPEIKEKAYQNMKYIVEQKIKIFKIN